MDRPSRVAEPSGVASDETGFFELLTSHLPADVRDALPEEEPRVFVSYGLLTFAWGTFPDDPAGWTLGMCAIVLGNDVVGVSVVRRSGPGPGYTMEDYRDGVLDGSERFADNDPWDPTV